MPCRKMSPKRSMTSRQYLYGGKADYRKRSSFSSRALAEGMRVEREHTNNPRIAREIAEDHLAEDPQYYTKLRKAGL